MIRLTVTNRKTNDRKVYDLDRTTIVFGRAANCDVVLDSESVSRRHARLIVRRDLLEVEDLGSGNGTLVNLRKLAGLERVPLTRGDQIRVEEFTIDFDAEEQTHVGPAVRPEGKFEITDPDIIEIKMIKKILGAFDGDKRPCVVVVSAPFQHLRGYVDDGEGGEFVVGRDPRNGLAIDDATVSRRHARITRKWGGFAIADEGSKNGTFINGERVKGEKTLSDGDEIVFGTVKAVFKNPEEFSMEAISETLQADRKIADKVGEASELTRAESEKARAVGAGAEKEASDVPAKGGEATGVKPDSGPPASERQAGKKAATRPAAKPGSSDKSVPEFPEDSDVAPEFEGAAPTSAGKRKGLLRELSPVETLLFLFGLALFGGLAWAMYRLLK